jgi:hypothetical protein
MNGRWKEACLRVLLDLHNTIDAHLRRLELEVAADEIGGSVCCGEVIPDGAACPHCN